MIKLGYTYLHLKYRPLEIDDLEKIARLNYELAFEAAFQHLKIQDIEVHSSIEEGSIIAKTKLLVAAGSLYILIGQYGSFVSGVDAIVAQTKKITSVIHQGILNNTGSNKHDIKVKRSGLGVPRKLQRLFEEVQIGELSVEDATSKALVLLKEQNALDSLVRNQIQNQLLKIKPSGNLGIPGVSVSIIPEKKILLEGKQIPVLKHESQFDESVTEQRKQKKTKRVEVWKSPEDLDLRIRYF